MPPSIAGTLASWLGYNENDIVKRTLSILHSAPEVVPMTKLLVSAYNVGFSPTSR
jgi:hypothetical protein